MFNTIKLEEQKSNNQHISNLLKNASKSGKGHGGFPDFIISFPTGKNYILVVECKPTRAQHEGKNRKKPKDFAVDGVLHYAKSLSKDFDVVAIAVSGDNENNLSVSHFLLKKDKKLKELNNKELLSIFDYSKVFDNERFADNLLDVDIIQKAISLNKQYQSYSITENERCTMISAILIGLMDKVFRKSYGDQKKIKHLTKFLIDAIDRRLDYANVENKEVMINEYNKIFNHPLFSQSKRKNKQSIEIAKEIIQFLHKNVYPLTTMAEKGFDVLGRFYSEFVRYAGDKKKQGLVLTPFHITDLFCDLVDINTESVVYDPCCGTGGFLISAMKAMLNLASANDTKKQKIRNEQLVGVEIRAAIYTYACSNMMFRGDGKSNIYLDDCFDLSLKIKEQHKPTIAFLNPPYDQGNADQMKFIEHALDVVSPQSGMVVAIVQMSCTIRNEKELLAIKKSILENHQLKAVFSMPNELFYPAAVVTAVMVFQTNKPNKGNKTWFGYFKDDGFEKRKHKGRIDIKNRWNGIKEKWLSSYRNMDEVAGLSIKKEVAYDDEWCAEAYMETDYSQINQGDFEKVLREYVAFKFLNKDELCKN